MLELLAVLSLLVLRVFHNVFVAADAWASVVPFALLVPFVGSAASSIVFGETFGSLRLAGMGSIANSLLGSLEVDGSRFCVDFGWRPVEQTATAIRHSVTATQR